MYMLRTKDEAQRTDKSSSQKEKTKSASKSRESLVEISLVNLTVN